MLSNLEVVIAGGSGGLGAECARDLASAGARVVVSFKQNAARANALPGISAVLKADLASAEDRARLLDAAGNLYGLVVFAGDPARVMDPSRMEEAMRLSHEVNYLGPILLAREAAARMKARDVSGAIVLLSTMQAVSVFEGSTAYAAQKAALIHGAKILAKEYRGKTDVRVNVICPGVMQAGMAEASIASGKYDRFLQQDAIPRFGRAADVARAVRFLLQPDNYVTGQVLTIDGGLTL